MEHSPKSASPRVHPTSFSESLRLARTTRKLSQVELAQQLGVRRQSVALWESGEMPGPMNLQKLREFFGSELKEPVKPPTEAALAYWRGRVDQIALGMEAILEQQRALSRDMAGDDPTPASEDEDPHIQAALDARAKRGRKPGTSDAKRKAQ